MSWLLNPHGDTPVGPPSTASTATDANGAAASTGETTTSALGDSHPKVKDPVIANRMVSNKPANRPFLAYKEYREKREAEHKAWEQRMKERDEKIAQGLEVGPKEKDPTGEEEVGLVGLLKFIVYLLIFVVLAGKFITGSFLWEYEGKWTNLKTYMPSNQRLFSERLLSEFDGSIEGKAVYIAIDHDVYDVSSNRKTYGPGGSYHHMAGVDAARSFATGCFAAHRTHDIRGLTESELEGLTHWKQFFANHKSYFKVGKVIHPPIDPASPIPEPCDPKRRQESEPKKHTKDNVAHSDAASDKKPVVQNHKEL